MPPKRYFEELSKGIKPGSITDGLRQALGLHSDKLPIWIYRMRVLGYPPGWLKTADMTSSVVDLIDGDTPRSPKQPSTEPTTYNVESLVIYPGFNAPVPEGIVDHHELLKMPAMQQHQQLTYATKRMKTPKPVPYKRVKISSSSTPLVNLNASTISSDGIEILDISSGDDAGKSAGNGTKTDEGGQEVIVLDEGDIDASDKTAETSVDNGEIIPQTTEKVDAEAASNIEVIATAAEPPAKTKLISVGSPVPDSYKTAKPPLEKWSENNTMVDLIYFQNLPTSTGVFDKMRSVLGKVRDRLFNNVNDDTEATTSKDIAPENNDQQ